VQARALYRRAIELHVVVLIVLGVVLYGVRKIITDAANTATSAPLTTGQGAAAPPPSGMAR
jgi:hypothetical protein